MQRQDARPTRASRPAGEEPSPIETVMMGHQRLHRLDSLQRDLERAGETPSARLERLAIGLAEHVAPWIAQQPRDTLIVVFGERGFRWNLEPGGTSPASFGGAFPEQVLVPASAWLSGSRACPVPTAPGLH